jgi:hypothetical protein
MSEEERKNIEANEETDGIDGKKAEEGEEKIVKPEELYDDTDIEFGGAEEEILPDDKEDKEEVKDKGGDDRNQGEVSPELAARAEAMGISKEDVQLFGSAAAVERAVALLESKAAKLPAPDEPGGKEEKKDGEGEDAGDKKDGEDDDFVVVDLDPDEYDEPLVKGFKTMSKMVEKMKGLESRLKDIDSAFSMQGVVEFETKFDNWLEELGEAAEADLGKGRGLELKKDSPQMASRVKIIDEYQALADRLAKEGKPLPPQAELFEEALRRALPDVHSKVKKTKTPNNDQTPRGSRRPVSRHSDAAKSKDPRKEAVRFVNQKLREAGVTGE